MTPISLRLARRAEQLRRDRDGAAAVEFALVALPFFILVFGILEIGMLLFTTSVVEDSVSQAARDIRTGELQSAGQTESDFRAAVCARINSVADCSRLKIDVRPFDNFTSVNFDAPTNEDGTIDDSGFDFRPGDAGDVVLVRVYYEYQLFGPGLVNGLSNLPGNKRLISAATAFRNEPFQR